MRFPAPGDAGAVRVDFLEASLVSFARGRRFDAQAQSSHHSQSFLINFNRKRARAPQRKSMPGGPCIRVDTYWSSRARGGLKLTIFTGFSAFSLAAAPSLGRSETLGATVVAAPPPSAKSGSLF